MLWKERLGKNAESGDVSHDWEISGTDSYYSCCQYPLGDGYTKRWGFSDFLYGLEISYIEITKESEKNQLNPRFCPKLKNVPGETLWLSIPFLTITA